MSALRYLPLVDMTRLHCSTTLAARTFIPDGLFGATPEARLHTSSILSGPAGGKCAFKNESFH